MILVLLLILTATDGFGEEPAWRGFALPRLLDRHRAFVASMVVGVLWALWHLPLLSPSVAVAHDLTLPVLSTAAKWALIGAVLVVIRWRAAR